MRIAILIVLYAFSLKSLATDFNENSKTKIILNTIIEQMIPPDTVIRKPKESSGENYVKKMMKLNREKIKKLHEKSNEDDKRTGELEKTSFIKKYKEKEKLNLLSHKRTISETYKRWKNKKLEFYQNLSQYKNSLIQFEIPIKEKKKILERALLTPIFRTTKKIRVIPNSLEVEIKGQGKRPTCAAFAGIRAIEILSQKKGKSFNLSEQYFYWLSKPDCQKSPCSIRGSWVLKGFRNSKNALSPNIPSEKDCPYKLAQLSSNETQLPLKKGCLKGKVKVIDFQKIQHLDEVISHLDKGYPVVAAFRLSSNFYKNNGLVSLSDDPIPFSPDQHTKGHALVLEGYLELPRHLSRKEGKICFLAANSWTEGWGVGGHACLTENWIRKYKIPNAFISLKKIKI